MGVRVSTHIGHRRAVTVGELKKALADIPDSTPLELGLDDGVEVILMNDEGAPKGRISRVSLDGFDPDDADDDDDLADDA